MGYNVNSIQDKEFKSIEIVFNLFNMIFSSLRADRNKRLQPNRLSRLETQDRHRGRSEHSSDAKDFFEGQDESNKKMKDPLSLCNHPHYSLAL